MDLYCINRGPVWVWIESQFSAQTKTLNFYPDYLFLKIILLSRKLRWLWLGLRGREHSPPRLWLSTRVQPGCRQHQGSLLSKTERSFWTHDFIVLGCTFLGFVALKDNMIYRYKILYEFLQSISNVTVLVRTRLRTSVQCLLCLTATNPSSLVITTGWPSLQIFSSWWVICPILWRTTRYVGSITLSPPLPSDIRVLL